MRIFSLTLLWLLYLVFPNQGHSTSQDCPRKLSRLLGDPTDMIRHAIAANNEVWAKQFLQSRRTYFPPGVAHYKESVTLSDGTVVTHNGPFYMPLDHTIYLDVTFWSFMKNQLRTDTHAARAYVIAHETAHHVQNLLGYQSTVDTQLEHAPSTIAKNQVLTRHELHADYLAGRWAGLASGAHQLFDQNDVADMVEFVSKVGDDAMAEILERDLFQSDYQHGTSAKRKEAFEAGFKGQTSFERSVIPRNIPTLQDLGLR